MILMYPMCRQDLTHEFRRLAGVDAGRSGGQVRSRHLSLPSEQSIEPQDRRIFICFFFRFLMGFFHGFLDGCLMDFQWSLIEIHGSCCSLCSF